jgi:hypothetical protein
MNTKFCAAIFLVGSFTYSNVALGQDFSSPYAGNGQAGLITNQLNITQTAITRAASRTTKKTVPIANMATGMVSPEYNHNSIDQPQKTLIADSSDYGGGWAVPSLDTSISIGRDAVSRAIFDRQICKGCRSNDNSNQNSSSSSQSKPVRKSARLDFQPSLSRRKQNLSRFVENTRANNPQGAAQMAKLFASTDVIEQLGKSMAPYGLRTNNVADVYAVYWASAWLGSRGRNENLPKSQIVAIKNQATGALSSTAQFSSATDAQKQQFAEALLIQAVLIDASIDYAKSDPALLNKVKVAISQGAKAMGLDLDRMTLTPQGFRPANN